jgi:hypothetical protein
MRVLLPSCIPPQTGYLNDNRKAQKAAYRRAADLLKACGEARRRYEGAAAADGGYEGAVGLTRKLHYTGYVQVCPGPVLMKDLLRQ